MRECQNSSNAIYPLKNQYGHGHNGHNGGTGPDSYVHEQISRRLYYISQERERVGAT